jgi:hypothetical protein
MQSMNRHSTLVGVFEHQWQAQNAVRELRQAGFREDQIGVIARDGSATGGTRDASTEGAYAGTGAATGAIAGAGIGALWALGIAANVLPAIGPVISGGLLASVLASAAGAAATGGLVGALIGFGIPEEDAHYYEGEFQAGRTLVTVQVDGREDDARAILQRHGAYEREMAEAGTGPATITTTAGGTRTTTHSTEPVGRGWTESEVR